MKKDSKTSTTEAEVRLRIVLVDPPADVDFGIQEGKGNNYTTIHKQRSKDANLTFEFTVTIKDKAGSPNTYSSTLLLPANSSQVIPYAGLKFTGGLTLLSSANTSLHAQAWGFQ